MTAHTQGSLPLGVLQSMWSQSQTGQKSKSSPAPLFKCINSSGLSLYGSTLTSIHDYWKNHSFDYTDLCRQSDICFFYILSRFVIHNKLWSQRTQGQVL